MIRPLVLSAIIGAFTATFLVGNWSNPANGQDATPTAVVTAVGTPAGTPAVARTFNVYFAESEKNPSRFDRSPAGISRFAALIARYGAVGFTLDWRLDFPTDADLVIIDGPAVDLSPAQTARLWAYLARGGKLLLIVDPFSGASKSLPSTSGLFTLSSSDMGVRMRSDVIVAPSDDKPLSPNTPITVPNVTFMAGSVSPDSPITQGLSQFTFRGARSIELDSLVQGGKVTPLIFTPPGVYGESAFDDLAKNGSIALDDKDTPIGSLVVAAAVERSNGARIVMIGDADFATNNYGLQTAPANSEGLVFPDHARFLVNAVLWLVGEPSVMQSFPTPGATLTPTYTLTPSATFTPSPIPQATKTS